jgi:polyribonucleotide nucleotidyltransferase
MNDAEKRRQYYKTYYNDPIKLQKKRELGKQYYHNHINHFRQYYQSHKKTLIQKNIMNRRTREDKKMKTRIEKFKTQLITEGLISTN